MKVKRKPEDFEVTELTDVVPKATGRFGLYRLTKTGVGTPEAVDTILKAWRIPRKALSYGGLKDRHALTRQHLTIQGGPPRDLEAGTVRLEHLGRSEAPFTAKELRGNHFRLVLRDMGEPEVRAALAALPDLERDGVPNYFDDQRFGSVTREGHYPAEAWVRGEHERALKIAFAESNTHDRPADRGVKRILQQGWGDWEGLKKTLGRSHLRSIVTFLADRPGDFRGALAVVRADLRSLWLAAFQSHLFNRVLAAVVEEADPGCVTLDLREGPTPFWLALDDRRRARLADLELPLPSARVDVPPGPVRDLVERVLARERLASSDLDVADGSGSFFSKGWRRAVLRPEGLAHEEADDDLYRGRHRMSLAFDLPKGAYATLVVKRLTAVPAAQAAPSR